MIAGGADHTCAIAAAGTVACWGDGSFGQLGSGSDQDSIPPLTVPELAQVTTVASGEQHTCVLVNKQVTCWGRNADGQLGRGDNQPSLQRKTLTLSDVTFLTAGVRTTCAIRDHDDRYLVCWGDNQYGQIDDTNQDKYAPDVVDQDVVSVAVGVAHICYVTTTKRIKCRGDNSKGQLGIGSTTPTSATQLLSSQGVVSVVAGAAHTCYTLADGRVYCWGDNQYGQLGVGHTSIRMVPTRVTMDLQDLAAGFEFTCGRVGAQRFCWGRNDRGQLGVGSTESASTPQPVIMLDQVQQLGVGHVHACAYDGLGAAHCWGDNRAFQLGAINSAGVTEPHPVAVVKQGGELFESATAIAVGRRFACAIQYPGSLWCWWSQEGGTVSFAEPKIQAFSATGQVTIGHGHGCALNGDTDVLSCWGENEHGEVGTGAMSQMVNPPYVHPGQWSHVSAGARHVCAIRKLDAQLFCWGANESGQLGVPGNGAPAPVSVPDMNSLIAVESGSQHTCAARSDGTVWCWGRNDHLQAGVGAAGGVVAEPTQVAGLLNVFALAAGEMHTCALQDDGMAACWGSNALGQLGRGSAGGDMSPGVVPSLNSIVAITAGASHTCVTRQDNEVRCFGSNAHGQLANSTNVSSSVPALITFPTYGPDIVAAGYDLTCFKADGTGVMLCAGAGPLGSGGPRLAQSPQRLNGIKGKGLLVFRDGFEAN